MEEYVRHKQIFITQDILFYNYNCLITTCNIKIIHTGSNKQTYDSSDNNTKAAAASAKDRTKDWDATATFDFTRLKPLAHKRSQSPTMQKYSAIGKYIEKKFRSENSLQHH